MTGDRELDVWRQQWKARDAVPSDLRQRVEREIRAARYAHVPPIAVTVLIGGGMLGWAVVAAQRDVYVLTAATWIFIVVTWLASVGATKWIGITPVPAAGTATAFLDFTIQVCRGKRAAIRIAAVLYPVFFSFMLAWRYQTLRSTGVGEFLLTGPVLTHTVIMIVLAVIGLGAYRRLGTELGNLRVMRAQLEGRLDSPRAAS